MDLQQVREFLKQQDNQEVQTFLTELRGTPSIEDIQNLATSDEQVKKWLQSEKDSFFSKGLETWKSKTLPQLLEEEIKKRYPEETAEQRELRELKAQFEQIKVEKERESLRAMAKGVAIEKNLPHDLVDFFVAQDAESTQKNLELFEQSWKQALKAVAEEIFKQNGREPHASSPTGSTIENPWKRETFNLTKQAQILRENPELAKQLQSQV